MARSYTREDRRERRTSGTSAHKASMRVAEKERQTAVKAVQCSEISMDVLSDVLRLTTRRR